MPREGDSRAPVRTSHAAPRNTESERSRNSLADTPAMGRDRKAVPMHRTERVTKQNAFPDGKAF